MNANIILLSAALPAIQTTSQVAPGPLRFTLDVAQLVMLGGLIWRLSDMNSAVKSLTLATGKLTTSMEDMVTRVTVLETRDEARRDRRKDDAG